MYTKIIILPNLIMEKIASFGDNSSAYELAVCLVNLIEYNPNNKAVKFIEAEMNMLLGRN